ncbi:MAG: SMC-Scp complex subunit ScpB [Frankiaceae bacterium]|nr:SMC-Scp complex subunit ScpB [Frankiaceae bacterium]
MSAQTESASPSAAAGLDPPGGQDRPLPALPPRPDIEAEPDPASALTPRQDPAGQLEAWVPDRLRMAVEAVLFVSDAPLAVVALAAGLSAPIGDVAAALDALSADYAERGAGIELREVAGGVRLFTREEAAPAVERFLRDGQRARLTRAALETVAVIAYRQPVTRSRISAIRGVNVDGVIRTLLSRGLIVEIGTDSDTGGILYGTTEVFLEKMGLGSLDELPSLAPLLPEIDTVDIDST